MKHLFLTGDIQTGKTTAIARFCESVPGLRLGGFATKNVPLPGTDGERGVYILPPRWEAGDLTAERLAARQRRGRWEVYPRVFDLRGAAFLEAAGPFDLLLMDELGRMELNAPRFRAAVLRALDGEVPVLGVVKPESNPFLDAVRAHPRVEVLTLTPENRDEIPARLGAFFNLRAVGER